MLPLLLRRRARSLRNTLRHWTAYERVRNLSFAGAGVGLLYGLHHGFYRLLSFVGGVELIGALLTWKLTAMMLLMTFSMVAVSSLLTSMTALYYSYDLRFLMKAPVSLRAVFLDKSLESAFFASWMIGLILVPYVLALQRVWRLGWWFSLAFAAALPPFLLLAASFGIAFSLLLLYLFPSSRTRDVVWAFSSLFLSVLYGLVRFAQPERLIRPDALRVVAEYLVFLQAPTAPGLPSWWLTRALQAAAQGHWGAYARDATLLWGAALAAYGLLAAAAGVIYFVGYSGAQEGSLRRRAHSFMRLRVPPLLWKDGLTFARDVKYWSQLLLIGGLVFVYLFSIRRLPLDTQELRSLIAFLNVGAAGFVLSALGLRFTFPSVSLEGRAWWVLRCAPIDLSRVMRQKLAFSAAPIVAVALALGLATNAILDADRFTSWLSLGALMGVALVVCAMGIGLGSFFPRFNVENIHQIESSLGGFVYMAASLFYVALTLALLAVPLRMNFLERLGKTAWDGRVAAAAGATWLVLSVAAVAAPWAMGRRALESHEE